MAGRYILLVALVVLAAACGGATDIAPPASSSDLKPAPDFTLLLASGEEFVLSEAAKPVYIIFWAEW